MGKILAFSQHKGGTGKTTLCLNIGAQLAQYGYKVLLVDLDPQTDMTNSLIEEVEDDSRPSLYSVLMEERGILEEVVVQTTWPNLYLLPGTLDMADIELELVGKMGREMVLKEALDTIAGDYDFIFLDCPPSLGLITINALVASSGVIVPVQAQPRAVRATARVAAAVDKVKRKLNHRELKIIGYVLTMAQSNKVSQEAIETMRQLYGDKVFPTAVALRVKLAEDALYGAPLLAYAPKSLSAEEIKVITDELLNRVGGIDAKARA